MKKIYVVVLFLFLYSQVRAETLEFLLSDITGGFYSYRASLIYTGEAVQFSSVSLRVEAAIVQSGVVMCIHAPGVPQSYWGPCTFGPVIEGWVWKNLDKRSGYKLSPLIVEPAGQYDQELELSPLSAFSELDNGDVINVSIYFSEGWWCCHPDGLWAITDPEGTLTSVTLIIKVSDPVPVEDTTWGRIKSLYVE